MAGWQPGRGDAHAGPEVRGPQPDVVWSSLTANRRQNMLPRATYNRGQQTSQEGCEQQQLLLLLLAWGKWQAGICGRRAGARVLPFCWRCTGSWHPCLGLLLWLVVRLAHCSSESVCWCHDRLPRRHCLPARLPHLQSSPDGSHHCCPCSEMFGANYFIVSQTNPRVVPLLNARRRWGTAGQLAEAELKHRCVRGSSACA
mgnify:CR=1 FL=1